MGFNRWDRAHYIFHPDFWVSGYCTEALRSFLEAVFELQPDRKRIYIVVSARNAVSRRVLEKRYFVKDDIYRPQENLEAASENVSTEPMEAPVDYTELEEDRLVVYYYDKLVV
jgi:RimJ/RimL family protein N-acetyltransferase